MKALAPAKSQSLYLIEFYTNEPNKAGGFKTDSAWDINFAWVYAQDKTAARFRLKNEQGRRLCEIIQCSEQCEITRLFGDFRVNTPDANLFIYQVRRPRASEDDDRKMGLHR